MSEAALIVALLLVAITMALALAHALEFPGKARLGESDYRVVQEIYYPGFTIGGLVGEFGGIFALIALLAFGLVESKASFWVGAALALMLCAHAVYWLVTHPVNKTWVKNTPLGGASRAFFGAAPGDEMPWRRMRDVWEWSHVARATLFMGAFLAMSWAIAV